MHGKPNLFDAFDFKLRLGSFLKIDFPCHSAKFNVSHNIFDVAHTISPVKALQTKQNY